jgi:AsmA-like C-terminal region
MTRFRRWLAGFAVALLLLGAADFAVSLLVGSRRVGRLLTARLEASFGRPVQVGRYRFSVWDGPGIEADSVVVGEDPRFGHEYFLRAGQLSATLRWGSLLRGRVEFGSFSLSDASLNIVTSGGEWNLAHWLPPHSTDPAGERSGAPRLYRIDVSDGRINFKRGVVKLPFALVDVNGTVDETAPGRWSLSLEADPMRAAVTLQNAGTLHVTGQVGGTSTRLRPASLDLSWQDASVSDVLRLVFGFDHGIRGRQDLDLRASSTGKLWQFHLAARASGLHRWDFVAQPANPAVNVHLDGSWSPGEGKLTLARGDIQAPSSSIALSGGLSWPVASLEDTGAAPASPKFQLLLATKGIGVQDLLSWYRSFHRTVPASLRAVGWLDGTAEIDGWPLRVRNAAIEAAGLRAHGGALSEPVELGSAKLSVAEGNAALSVSDLDFGPRIGRFQLTGRARRGRRWDYRIAAAGSSGQVENLVGAIEALGVRTPAYWKQFSGGAAIKIDWSGTIPFSRQTVQASLDLHDAIWHEPSLPAQVRLENAHVDAANDRLRFDIRSAQALGASWRGWLERGNPSKTWQFALAANGLDAQTLLARFRPQERHPSLIERIFGFGHAAGSPPLWPASLDASGTLALNRFSMAPLDLDGLRGRVAIRNGRLELSSARARFYGGRVRGSLVLSFENGVPVWRLETRLNGVDLSRLSSAFGNGEGRFSGTAGGELQISARGSTARALLDSLQGQADISARNMRDRGINWLATFETGHVVRGSSEFHQCSTQFRLAAGKLTVQGLSAVSLRGRLEATGAIDLAHGGTLAVDASYFPFTGFASRGAALEARNFQVTGDSSDPFVRFLPQPIASKVPPSR